MDAGSRVARVAAMIGEPGRAAMLAALMDGRAHTAGELAAAAGVSAATASEHLGKLLDRRLVAVAASGRHRYYRLASGEIARMLESIMVVADGPVPGVQPASRVPAELREARTCYDHIAGRLGVAINEALTGGAEGHSSNGESRLTARGLAVLTDLGINPAEIRERSRRAFFRPCLDWSERRPHLAGALGAEILDRLLSLGWIKRVRGSRELRATSAGARQLHRHFGFTRL